MPEVKNQQIVARQVERIVRQLSSLSTLPAVASGLLSQINENHFDPSLLVEGISTDPALAAKVLTLARREGVVFTHDATIEEAVAKLPLDKLREAVISVKVFQAFDASGGTVEPQLERQQMAVHSLSVACCAGLIAERVLPAEQRQTAYLAGLLHDIGKRALDEVMPKGFQRMIEQARLGQKNLAEIEQTHLGLDHTVLGKRLAQKWSLPEPIVSAIWLHHCDAHELTEDLPDVQIPRVVALADRLVRQTGLGHSGSFDQPEGTEELAQLLGISDQQVDEIIKSLPQAFYQKSELLGLDVPEDPSRYYTLIHQAATNLVRDNHQLRNCTQQQQHLTDQTELVSNFLSEIDENASSLDIARQLASCWQSHFRSGMTFAYIVTNPTEPYVDLVALDRSGRADTQTLQLPENTPPIPEAFLKMPSIIPAAGTAKWIAEQLEIDFNPQLLNMVPLKLGDEIVGVLVFEGFSDKDSSDVSPLPLICKVAAATITMAQAVSKNEKMAERFVNVMNMLRKTRSELARRQSFKGLADMAAGAAHELNNPLAVISGRAQLLMDSENDDNKRQILEQIKSRTEEISQIVTDLLAFAQPSEPEKRTIAVLELLHRAVEMTQKACGQASLEIDISGQSTDSQIYVDAHQVTQSLSFILNNALESYKGGNGPIYVDCSQLPVVNAVSIAISDKGCGMDAQTLAAACEPFFSACPAGRRRGMGLAHAQRLLELNGGDLKLTSEPDIGTTVTVILPKV